MHQLTIRQRADCDVLRGDAWTVLVVGYNTEAVFCVLLQAGHGVRLSVHVNVLDEGKKARSSTGSALTKPTLRRHVCIHASACDPWGGSSRLQPRPPTTPTTSELRSDGHLSTPPLRMKQVWWRTSSYFTFSLHLSNYSSAASLFFPSSFILLHSSSAAVFIRGVEALLLQLRLVFHPLSY